MHVLSRFSWRQVRDALSHIRDCCSYYVGGTLCIDMAQGYTVCLNRSGRGFAFISGGPEVTFIMPKDVEATVNQIYQEVKVSASNWRVKKESGIRKEKS